MADKDSDLVWNFLCSMTTLDLMRENDITRMDMIEDAHRHWHEGDAPDSDILERAQKWQYEQDMEKADKIIMGRE